MCGIAGLLHKGAFPEPGLIVGNMAAALAHRGPDTSGYYNDDFISFGHKRLSIIDLDERATQPMLSSDGRYCIVYNGEIYNYNDLRNELEQLGWKFHTTSDTEVILIGFQQWKEKVLDRLDGMFAFAIYDSQERSVFLARDRFGKKPLYYTTGPGWFCFASETGAIHAAGIKTLKPALTSINQFLAIGYVLSPSTLYEDVYQLPPAHYMWVKSNAALQISRYWNYADYFRSKRAISEKEAAAELLRLLKQAIEKRLVADVEIGSFLSGGIDSSAIVAIAGAMTDGLKTFCAGFTSGAYDESTYARKAAEQFKCYHNELKINSLTETELLTIVHKMDQPFADNSYIPFSLLSAFAAKKVKVILSGDGADEMFGGYETYQADLLYNKLRFIHPLFKKGLGKLGESVWGKKDDKIGWKYRWHRFFFGAAFDYKRAHYSWRLYFTPEERIQILGRQNRELVYDTDPYKIFESYYNEVPDLEPMDQHFYVDAMTWLPDDILFKVDRASMLSGLEVRCPFLDIELAQFAASLPTTMKLKQGKGKIILKQALEDILPESILTRKKSGFNAPVGHWLHSDVLDEFRTFNKFVYTTKIKPSL